MTDLVCWVSDGRAELAHVKRVIEGEAWNKAICLCYSPHAALVPSSAHAVVIDHRQHLPEMVEAIRSELDGKVSIMDTAVNLFCGSGKQHMALMSALLKLGCGVRLVALTKDGVQEI